MNSLRTNIHNKDGITHSFIHSKLFSPFTFESSIFSIHFSLLHTCHVVLAHSIYTGRDKALQIIWTLCQYVINRTRQQFTVGFCHCFVLFYCNASRELRSNSSLKLTVPRTRLKLKGDRAFSVAAPQLWNNLPSYIRSAPTYADFKFLLKTYLFTVAYGLK